MSVLPWWRGGHTPRTTFRFGECGDHCGNYGVVLRQVRVQRDRGIRAKPLPTPVSNDMIPTFDGAPCDDHQFVERPVAFVLDGQRRRDAAAHPQRRVHWIRMRHHPSGDVDIDPVVVKF